MQRERLAPAMRRVKKALVPGDPPQSEQSSYDDAGIEEISKRARRRIRLSAVFERPDVPLRVPRTLEQEVRSPVRGANVGGVGRACIQIRQNTYGVACDLRRYASVPAEVGMIVTGEPAAGLLNT